MLCAEDVYTALLQHDASLVSPGAKGTSRYTVQGREFNASWEVRQNAVWRRGRVFLRANHCSTCVASSSWERTRARRMSTANAASSRTSCSIGAQTVARYSL